jgi:hypothetical protein
MSAKPGRFSTTCEFVITFETSAVSSRTEATMSRADLHPVDIVVVAPERDRELAISVSPRRLMRDVLRAAAARFHVLDDATGIAPWQLRRDGDAAPIDLDDPAGLHLRHGDRLIIERVTSE